MCKQTQIPTFKLHPLREEREHFIAEAPRPVTPAGSGAGSPRGCGDTGPSAPALARRSRGGHGLGLDRFTSAGQRGDKLALKARKPADLGHYRLGLNSGSTDDKQ